MPSLFPVLSSVLTSPSFLSGLSVPPNSCLSLWLVVPDIPLPLSPSQQRWAPGTQCMTKCENSRPKPGELAFRKGDVVTILEACEVRGELGVKWCAFGVPGQIPGSPPICSLPVQDKSWYRAKHHSSGQEGLLAATALRQREALSTDPKLSLMP